MLPTFGRKRTGQLLAFGCGAEGPQPSHSSKQSPCVFSVPVLWNTCLALNQCAPLRPCGAAKGGGGSRVNTDWHRNTLHWSRPTRWLLRCPPCKLAALAGKLALHCLNKCASRMRDMGKAIDADWACFRAGARAHHGLAAPGQLEARQTLLLTQHAA